MANPILVKLPGAIFGAVLETLTSAAGNPNVPVQIPNPQVVEKLAEQITEKVTKAPEIAHAASTEKWWQARSNWAWISAAFISPALAALGYNMTPEDHIAFATLGMIVGNGIAAWMAYRARRATKPLFSK